MEKRKYLREELSESTKDRKYIYGENTVVTFSERRQGKSTVNGKTFNQILVGVNLEDIKLRSTSKYTDCFGYQEAILVQYALDLMEHDLLEEFYKTVLLLTKDSYSRTVTGLTESLSKYDRGEYTWPIVEKNVDSYRKELIVFQKAVDSIDVTTDDLKYFNQYKREGLSKIDY